MGMSHDPFEKKTQLVCLRPQIKKSALRLSHQALR